MSYRQYQIDRHDDRVRGGNSYTPEQLQRVFRRQGERCVRCGRKRPLTIDHIVPGSKRGPNVLLNVQGLCLECNSIKGQHAIDYRNERFATLRRFYRRYQGRNHTARNNLPSVRGMLMKFVAKSLLLTLAVFVGVLLLPGGSLLASSVAASAWSSLLAWVVTTQALAGLGVLVVLVLIALHLKDRRELVYPDEFGRLPVAKGEILDRPQIAAATWQAAHVRDYERAIRHGPTHFTYSPKWPTTKGAEELESAAPLALPALPTLARLADVRKDTPANHLALGVLPGGELLSAPPSDCYHVLFHGETRSGKTNAIDSVITQLHHMAARGMPLTLYAGDKKGEFAATWQGSLLFPEGIQTETDEIADMLDAIVNDPTIGLLARNKQFARAATESGRIIRHIDDYEAVTGERLPRVFVFVDEINALLLEARRNDKLEAVLMQALQMGASAGYYILGGAQHLTAQTFGTEGRNQFVTRAHFGAYNQSAISMLFGRVDHEALRSVMDGTRGRGLIRTVGRADPVPFQALKCDEQDILDAIAAVSRPALPDDRVAQNSAVETPRNMKNVSDDTLESTQTDASQNVSSVSGPSLFEQLGGTPEDRDKILFLAFTAKNEGLKLSRRAIARNVYGYETGAAAQKVKAVLDQAGL